MLGYDLEEERREERPRESRPYDAEDEPVDVEGDSLGWPEAAINVDGNLTWLRFQYICMLSMVRYSFL